ncbi:MAG: CAP domain-containing protein [Myxococcales bacterium]|nr:CAP domain-containing protein [Myxococcales bacterium]MCB9750873.1 CAP domain-containing protein [Myxococcales bacterium]
MPDNEYCAPAAEWDASWAALEQEVIELVNAERASGANCGGTQMPATSPLKADPALRCAARVHTKDMVDNDYFDHTNLQGEGPGPRIEKAGYSWSTYGENIAAGNATAEATVQQWMESPGHCSNIMNPDFEDIGVGYQPGGAFSHTWTQVFGRTF